MWQECPPTTEGRREPVSYSVQGCRELTRYVAYERRCIHRHPAFSILNSVAQCAAQVSDRTLLLASPAAVAAPWPWAK